MLLATKSPKSKYLPNGSKYVVTFPLSQSSSSYATYFNDYELASKYLYEIVDEVVV